jgi:hypothetical protein
MYGGRPGRGRERDVVAKPVQRRVGMSAATSTPAAATATSLHDGDGKMHRVRLVG